MIFFSTRFCAVNFGGIEKISVESKSVFCKFFFVKSQRLYQAQSAPQV